MMRYGIFGGAFDPIHLGHLLLAESCLRQAELDRIVFVPTGVSPHRAGKGIYRASGNDRFNMVESAIVGCKEFIVSRYEIDRQEPSYTVETLRYFQKSFAEIDPKFFLLMGADMFNDLPNWKQADEICCLAVPLAVQRPNTPLLSFESLSGLIPLELLEEIRISAIQMPQMELSSTKIRAAIAERKSIRFQVPQSVESYITAHKLYQQKY